MKKFLAISLFVFSFVSFSACDKDSDKNNPVDPSTITSEDPTDLSRDPNLPEGYPTLAAQQNAVTIAFHMPQAANNEVALFGTFFNDVAKNAAEYRNTLAKQPVSVSNLGDDWYAVFVYPAYNSSMELMTTPFMVGDQTYNGIQAIPVILFPNMIRYAAIDKAKAGVYPTSLKNAFTTDANANIFISLPIASSYLSTAVDGVLYVDNVTLSNSGIATFNASLVGEIPEGYQPYLSAPELTDYPITDRIMFPKDDGTYTWTGDFVADSDGTLKWTVILVNGEQDVIKTQDVSSVNINTREGLDATFNF